MPKLKIGQNIETQNMTNTKCDNFKTQGLTKLNKMKMQQHSKNLNVTKLKN